MFQHLSDFGHQRTKLQALGFYLVYVFAGIIAGGAIGFLTALLTSVQSFDGLMLVGGAFAVAFNGMLMFLVLKAKGRLGHIGYLLVGLLGVAATVLGGLILGVIFTAVLTTRSAASADEGAEERQPVGAAY